MSLKTTILLLVLAVGGAGLFAYHDVIAPKLGLVKPKEETVSPSQTVFADEFKPEKLARIEIVRGKERIVFVHSKEGWSLDGNWPARMSEVQQVVDLLTGLSSRFEPIGVPPGRPDLFTFGISPEQTPLKVIVTTRSEPAKKYEIVAGEPPFYPGNPFGKPTYMRLDQQPEVIRLAPGLLRILDRPRTAYLKRQLFPEVERVKFDSPRPSFPGESEPPTPVNQLLDAKQITVTGPQGAWTLHRRGPPLADARKGNAVEITSEKLAERWELTKPVADGVEPDKVRTILAAVPELWVEKFLDSTDLAAAGLDKPEYSVSVEFDKRPPVTLLIGKVSRVEERKAAAPAPANPFSPPPPPPPAVREEFRFAKLPDNPQLFEVKTDKFADLFVAAGPLRDPKLLRFKPADVRRVEIVRREGRIILAKDNDKWKLAEPITVDADAPRVTELVDRLAELQATGADLVDKANLKALDLETGEKYPSITIVAGEKDKPDTQLTLYLRIGKHDAEKKKLAVQAAGNPRVAMIGDELLKLYDRSAFAYRGKRLLDVPAAKLATISIQRGGEALAFAQQNGVWSLTAPVATLADAAKAGALARDLGTLNALEFVADANKPEELAKFGLDKPALTATATFSDGSPPKTLALGKAIEGKPEVYARLADSPSVFTLPATLRDTLDQSSLVYRPLQLWQIAPDAVTALDVSRPDESYMLTKAGTQWKLSGPFNANASAASVQPLLGAVTGLRVERFEAHSTTDVVRYGLDKPALKVGVTSPAGVKSLLIGKTVAADVKSRYAKLADSDAVVVVPAAFVAAVDRPAFDLLDRQLLSLNVNLITDVKGTGPDGDWSLHRADGNWTINSMKPPLPADKAVADELIRPLADYQATRLVAYGPRVDFERYGLDRPRTTMTVTLQPAAGAAPETHTLALGLKVRDAEAYYVRVDGAPGVAEVPAALANVISRSDLDFADRSLLTFDPAELVGIQRRGRDEWDLSRKDDGWVMTKPEGIKVDPATIDEIVEKLSKLRASRIVALDIKDPARYELDPAVATIVLQLKSKDGKTSEKTLQVGRETFPGGADPAESRFVRVAGSSVIAVVPPVLGKRLAAEPFKFRDRMMARFADADRAFVERGTRTAAFAKIDGNWKMTEPVAADAEQADLDELVNAVARLRADELVAEKPGDLKRFGLDAPEVRWRFLAGEREVLNLLIGRKDGASGQRFAKRADSDIVFLLDAGLVNRLLGEYRKRSLWTNLDAAQIETFVYAVGDKTLVLQKVDNNWQVPGKPDQIVNAAAVNELLGALATLRVERFVVDKNADLKLYGLQPSVRAIVVRPKTGNPSTLYLGTYEGGSKRVYGRLLDPARSDVFVLSEADSAKLVKELGAFTGK